MGAAAGTGALAADATSFIGCACFSSALASRSVATSFRLTSSFRLASSARLNGAGEAGGVASCRVTLGMVTGAGPATVTFGSSIFNSATITCAAGFDRVACHTETAAIAATPPPQPGHHRTPQRARNPPRSAGASTRPAMGFADGHATNRAALFPSQRVEQLLIVERRGEQGCSSSGVKVPVAYPNGFESLRGSSLGPLNPPMASSGFLRQRDPRCRWC